MSGNGMISLTHPDEVFYIQSAKEMIAHKSWITPYIFDAPQFEKPILFYWLLMLVIKMFDLSSFWARFCPSLFGILGVAVTYAIAWMIFRSKRLAFLSGFILSTSFIYVAMSRAVLTDMVFSIWVVITVGFFYLSYHYPGYKQVGIILCFVFSALAVLTKGFLGFFFPAIIILVYLTYKRHLSFLISPVTLIGSLIFLIIVVPWHVLMYKLYGQEFIKEYFYNVHLRRIFEAEHPKCNKWYFYPGVMIGGIFPWSFWACSGGFWLIQQIRKVKGNRDGLIFITIWILTVLGIMQLAQSKLASYILPLFPALAIMLAYYFHNIGEAGPNSIKGFKVVGYVISIFLLIAVVGTVVAGKIYIDFIVDMKPIYVFAMLSTLSATLIFILNQHRQYNRMILSNALITSSVLIILFLGHAYVEPWVSCKQICDVFKNIDHSQTTILTSKFYVRGVRFYTDRKLAVIDINGKGFFSPHPIPFFNSDSQVLTFLENQPFTFGILKKGNLKDLNRIIPGRFHMIQYTNIGDKYIVKLEKIDDNDVGVTHD